jgi:hypothetical protein
VTSIDAPFVSIPPIQKSHVADTADPTGLASVTESSTNVVTGARRWTAAALEFSRRRREESNADSSENSVKNLQEVQLVGSDNGYREAALELARRERTLQLERTSLIKERDALSCQLQRLSRAAEHVPRAPTYWTNQELTGKAAKLLWTEGSEAMYAMLRRTVKHSCCSGRDGTFEIGALQSVRVWWVENPLLWRQYCNKATEMESRIEMRGARCSSVSPPIAEQLVDSDLPSRLQHKSLNNSLNEAFLWHGSSKAKIDNIVEEGFDERLSNLRGMLGGGLYFAEDSCKSGQYSEKSIASTRSHWFVLSRVLLGSPHYTKAPMPDIRRPPVGCDSVVFDPAHDTGLGHHREFVIYDRFQAYPEFIVEARTAGPLQ